MYLNKIFFMQRQIKVVPKHSLSEALFITYPPLPPENTNELASPLFRRLDRKWKLYFQKGLVRLRHVQGLEVVEVVARQVLHEVNQILIFTS